MLALIVLVVLLALPYLIPLPQGTDPTTLADPDGTFVSVDGLRTYLLARGPQDGPVVLLLHGFGGSTFSWRENLDTLAEAGYRAIAFDRPGFGLSDKPLEHDYSHPAQADFTAHLLDALRVERATLVGHSAGGSVATHFALRHPERLERLVIVDGAVLSGGGPEWVGAVLYFPPLARWFQVGANWLLTRERFVDILRSAYADPEFVTPAVAEGYARVLQTPAWAAGLAGMVRAAGSNRVDPAQVATIQTQTLLAWGELDTWVPLAQGQQLLDLLPNAILRTYPQAGHLPMEEAAGAFNRDVLAFLSAP